MIGIGAIPGFLITIDTEGDNLWSSPKRVTTDNSRWLPRFQSLCERYSLKPTYLTNNEMARCPAYREFAADVLERGAGEVGMHLHAWDSPPDYRLTEDDIRHHPYLIEYPVDIIRAKIGAMTVLLEDTFGRKMVSHRAGRWALNTTYAQILAEEGYRVDCSVTPGVSWQPHLGDPRGSGGTDYRGFPLEPYFLDLEDISRPGISPLLEIPVSIAPTAPRVVDAVRSRTAKRSLLHRACNRLYPPLTWLRPNGQNRRAMLRLLARAERERRAHVELMLHSSELMPGGSPYFPTEASVEGLYRDLEQLFAAQRGRFEGATLSEFAARFSSRFER